MSEFMSIRATAKRLHISPVRLREAIREGSLPAYRVSDRLIRLNLAEVEAWVRSHRITPAPDHVRDQARAILDELEQREAGR